MEPSPTQGRIDTLLVSCLLAFLETSLAKLEEEGL